jgi:Uri superfamily endonuclease
MDKGIYCLVFRNPDCTVRVGALGGIRFRDGWHVYVGSALGPGGLRRLARHIGLAAVRDKKPKWHVDYLLVNPEFRLTYAVSTVTTERLECRLASGIGGDEVPSFGCSDCACISHLLYFHDDPLAIVRNAFGKLGLSLPITTLIRPSGDSEL